MSVARNEINFTDYPFIEGPNYAYYVQPHKNFREFPVFRFPFGIPNIGEIVEINVKRDTRLTENQFSTIARTKNLDLRGPKLVYTNPGTLVERTIVRIKRLPMESKSRFCLTLNKPDQECKYWAWGAFIIYLAHKE